MVTAELMLKLMELGVLCGSRERIRRHMRLLGAQDSP
ncbi:MAG: hypothetical protein ACI9J2_001015 [Saprospiraceae bacterium]|jgi:hypothetical protein